MDGCGGLKFQASVTWPIDTSRPAWPPCRPIVDQVTKISDAALSLISLFYIYLPYPPPLELQAGWPSRARSYAFPCPVQLSSPPQTITDLDDFLTPSQACIIPVRNAPPAAVDSGPVSCSAQCIGLQGADGGRPRSTLMQTISTTRYPPTRPPRQAGTVRARQGRLDRVGRRRRWSARRST